MHSERYEVPLATLRAIAHARAAGGRVVAIGTTTVRSLESAALRVRLDEAREAVGGETSIFITPGHRFQWIDMLVTNFHLPRSTLLMLVAAFSGLPRIHAAYHHAIAQRYRFFSYGDAMLLQNTSS